MIHGLLSAASLARIRYNKPNTPFLGEIAAVDFITGAALANAIGLVAGTSQHSTAGWLKFKDPVDGKIKYVAKRPIRHSISWDDLNGLGASSGTRTVVIGGKTYRVRLFKGAKAGTVSQSWGAFDPATSHTSEWNRLMYHVSGKPFINSNNTLASEGISEGDWAKYSEADLVTHQNAGAGFYTICQELAGSFRVARGGNGVSHFNGIDSALRSISYGWRPVLELVE